MCDAGMLMQAVAHDPAHAPALSGLGYLYQRRGNITGAHACYTRALEGDPANADTLTNEAALLYYSGAQILGRDAAVAQAEVSALGAAPVWACLPVGPASMHDCARLHLSLDWRSAIPLRSFCRACCRTCSSAQSSWPPCMCAPCTISASFRSPCVTIGTRPSCFIALL